MKLSPQQTKMLQFIANGERMGSLPELMELSDNTIMRYMKLAKDNLGAKTKENAVAIAIREGLIE